MNKIMKFFIIMMGPGETSHGAAFGKHLIENGHLVSFGILREEYREFLVNLNSPIKLLKSAESVEEEFLETFYDVAVMCNSKIFTGYEFQKIAPEQKPFCCSIDSNWLFGKSKDYSWIEWLDKYYLNLPKRVFEFGLKRNGGNYVIPDNIMKKISVIGMIPSFKPLSHRKKQTFRNKLNVKSGQKLIFSYIGSGITFKSAFRDQFVSVMDMLYQKYRDEIKIINIGNQYEKPWFVPVGSNINSEYFYQILASSDLVFQHQGLGTLEQAISTQIPAIANVTRPKKDEKIHAHAWEVRPFEKAGLCKMHYYNDPIKNVLKSIEDLVFNTNTRQKMINAQLEHYSSGEEQMLKNIMGRLRR